VTKSTVLKTTFFNQTKHYPPGKAILGRDQLAVADLSELPGISYLIGGFHTLIWGEIDNIIVYFVILGWQTSSTTCGPAGLSGLPGFSALGLNISSA
jgi:hypothetical protein